MNTYLTQHLQQTFDVSPADAAQIAADFKPLDLKKGDDFLRADQHFNYLGFIESGLLREFLYHDGKEVTKWISGPGYFAVDLGSFLFGKTARVNMQALTDCRLQVLSKTDYAQVGRLVPKWPEIEKMFIARCFTVLEDRVVSHLALSAEERYDAFFRYNPDLFNQAPLQYLASLLGMTPETFSRIRKKRSKPSS
jgi:CRP-like cAMP-binding protein